MVVSEGTLTVRADRLKAFTVEVYSRLGMPPDEAEQAADVLVESDLRGVETHGVFWVKTYARRLKMGGINPRPNLRVVSELPTLALVDGDGGMGHLIGVRAMQMAVDRANSFGMAGVGVRNSNHYGMAAYYAMMALPHDMIGFTTTAGSGANMPPYGAVTPVTGNNPQAWAIPAGQERPIVVDMAHSVVAGSKIRVAAKKGLRIPEGWAIDEEGQPLTDPEAVLRRMVLLPVGGIKGYCLVTVMQALGKVLTGGPMGPEHTGGFANPASKGESGHFFFAIKIAALMQPAEFKERTDQLIHQIKSAKRAKGVERVYVPGEIEFEKKEDRLKNGIPLIEPVYRELEEVARDLGIALDLG